MSHDAPASTLGTCPACGQEIDPHRLVVRYLSTDETTRLLASCPACEELVRPIQQQGRDGRRD
ncbi:MAG: RNA polymerase-binding transcription factor DksA [Halovenus sp.]|jgi:RNA polymerase-binding transcription factor DksA